MQAQIEIKTYPSFVEFKTYFTEYFQEFIKDAEFLFVTDVSKDTLEKTFLESFPGQVGNEYTGEGGYGMRQYMNCRCCRSFIRRYGNLVRLGPNLEIQTLWDFVIPRYQFEVYQAYQQMVDNLQQLVRHAEIEDVFVVDDELYTDTRNFGQIGIPESFVFKAGAAIPTIYNHFSGTLTSAIMHTARKESAKSDAAIRTKGGVQNFYRSKSNCLKKGLAEISQESIEGLLYLIDQNPAAAALKQFESALQAFYSTFYPPENLADNYLWRVVVESPWLAAFPSTVVGVALKDLTAEPDKDAEHLAKLLQRVDPNNYQRQDISLITPAMMRQAEKTIADLGLESSLGRKFALTYEIPTESVLYVNASAQMQDTPGLGIFGQLAQDLETVDPNSARLQNATSISLQSLLTEVNFSSLEFLFEPRLAANLVSLIGPQDSTAEPLTKWGNPYTWHYKDGLADASRVRETVKSVGGQIDAPIVFSLGWGRLAQAGTNSSDDLDFHLRTPYGKIYFGNRKIAKVGFELDIDRNASLYKAHFDDEKPVENIYLRNPKLLPQGSYRLYVNNFRKRSGNSGFTIEFKLFDQVVSYVHNKEVRQKADVYVLDFNVDSSGNVTITKEYLEKASQNNVSSEPIWKLAPFQWQKVSVISESPNYWPTASCSTGERHIFFFAPGCQNQDDQILGVTKQFLRQDLATAHGRAFQYVGQKMLVQQTDSENQLSGLGFSQAQSGQYFYVRVDSGRVYKVEV
jgi:hypothetical protein